MTMPSFGKSPGETNSTFAFQKGKLGNGGCALIVQKREYGEIVVAVSLPFDS